MRCFFFKDLFVDWAVGRGSDSDSSISDAVCSRFVRQSLLVSFLSGDELEWGAGNWGWFRNCKVHE